VGVVDDFDDAVKKYPRKAVRELGKKDQWGNKIVQIWENENMELEAANLLDEGMSSSQIAQLKKAYGSIDRINVTGPAYKKAKAFIANMSKDELMTIAKAKVKWLSQFAASELAKSHDVKLKAKDYMESVSFSDFRKNLKEAKTGLPTGQSTVDYENSIQKLMKTLKKDPKNKGKSGNELRKLATLKLTGHKLKESKSIDEASKEGTVRIIDLGNKGQDKIRKELGVDKLPNKGFQVQVMTKGKFVNQGKPYKTMKDAEKVRSTGQHSMQFDEATLEEKTKWKIGDGRPRNGARIENERFWDLPMDSLKYIAKDAGEAMRANPTARKATTGPGNWADQVADAATVMAWRKKNGIKESTNLDKGNQMKTFKDLRESKYAVDIEGLPKFYMDSDSPGKVKMTLRKLLKNPSTLNDVHRVPEGEVKSDFRKRAAGKEEVEESFDDNLEKRAIAVAKKMSDNMTGAVKEIEKIKKGLSKRPAVKKALQLYNEGVDSEFEHQLEESDNKKLAKVIKLMDSTESSSEAIKIVAKQMTNGNTAAAKKLITQALKADLGEAKKLDPVGKADADIDNDGDVDKSDEYLHKRRKAVKKAIKKTTKKKSGEAEEESKQSSQKLSGKQEKITISPKTDSE
jgi:uncharacterized protein YoaH (UPF0181 family)